MKTTAARPFGFRKNKSANLLRIICLLLFLHVGLSSLNAQEAEDGSSAGQGAALLPETTPLVYLDCSPCDFNHVRRELAFVNYVRDPEKADIHVFVTSEGTGGGGREYEFSFFGRGAFTGTEYTLKHYVDRNATRDERRDALNSFLELGFASYMLQTPLATRFNLEYKDVEDETFQQPVHDPWNYWVFRIYAGRIELDLESNQNEFDSRWGFFVDRITNEWKLRFRPYFNYDKLEIQQVEEEDPVISIRHRHGLQSYAIKSLDSHWSAGLFGTYQTANERNIKHRFRLNPGVEYSLFPYQEATRKSITFTYQLGFSFADYYEETIFGQTEESLFNHRLQGSVSFLQPWGRVDTGLIGSHYFHDATHRRIEFYGRISVRVTEGLSLNFQTDYDVIQDQLALPAGKASLEEVLLQQRELATDFSLSGSIAISYTFGSDFSNIVNTRF